MGLKDALYNMAKKRLIMDIKIGEVSDIDRIGMKHKKDGTVKYTVERHGKVFKFTSEDLED